MSKFTFLLVLSVVTPLQAQADSSRSGSLYDELALIDSVLFDAAFVACDTQRVFAILADDIEFYHDKTGFESGEQVRQTFRRLTGNCPGRLGVVRELVAGTLEVYPIQNYGAVQMGDHRFIELGSSRTKARFVHLWRRTAEGKWELKRVLSLDHREE